MHPIHFHIGMYVAIAALLVTAMKSSENVIAAVYPESHESGLLHETYLREAETHQQHPSFSNMRVVSNSGS